MTRGLFMKNILIALALASFTSAAFAGTNIQGIRRLNAVQTDDIPVKTGDFISDQF